MPRTKADRQSEFQRRNRMGVIAADAGAAAAMAFAKAGFSDPALVLRWSEIVGPEVARLAQPLRFTPNPTGGTLVLRAVPGASLFLAHEKRLLAERINTYLGRPAVAQIRFAQGVLPARPAPKPVEKRRGVLSAADPVRAYDGPAELKNALQGLARRRNISP